MRLDVSTKEARFNSKTCQSNISKCQNSAWIAELTYGNCIPTNAQEEKLARIISKIIKTTKTWFPTITR